MSSLSHSFLSLNYLYLKKIITFYTYFYDTLKQYKFSAKTSEKNYINVIIAFKNTERYKQNNKKE